MRRHYIIAVVIWLVTAIEGAFGCTVFVQDDGDRHYYGSNFDWHIGMGYVLISPRGMAKSSLSLPEDPGQPARWRSIFGSVTFVQYGQGLPKGGMNEAGLAIEGLMLYDSDYPAPDHRPYIGSTSQFKQYILDTCATVADVMDHMARVRVAAYKWAPGIHFMVADAAGDSAVLAFKEGRLKIYRGADLPVKVLVNQDYARSLARQEALPTLAADFSSHTGGRFKTVARRLNQFRPMAAHSAVAYAMETLDRVSVGPRTQWRVVYDQSERKIYWRCGPGEKLRWLDLGLMDFDCRRPVVALDVQRPVRGVANGHLSPFTLEDNRDLVQNALDQSQGIIDIPRALWEDIWRLPQSETCTAGIGRRP